VQAADHLACNAATPHNHRTTTTTAWLGTDTSAEHEGITPPSNDSSFCDSGITSQLFIIYYFRFAYSQRNLSIVAWFCISPVNFW
jgi:hypothetical protein